MDSLTVKFDSYEQLRDIAGFVESIFNVYNKSSQDTIKSLNSKLESIDSETMLSVDLSNDEISLLGHICVILSCIDADEVIAGCNISSKITRLIDTKSDVPRFLNMLDDYNVPVEYCVGLFSSWCSCEGRAVIAEKCMDIQTNYNIVMTAVWEWVCTNDPHPDTDWTEEVDIYKEAINDYKTN